METLRELTGSLRSYLKGRFSNPLWGAFLIAWGVLNFRLLLILFSDQKAPEKISYIDQKLYLHWWDWALYGYLLPLLTAACFVMAGPYLNRWVAMFLRRREKATIESLLDIEAQTPLPPDEAVQLRREVIDMRSARQRDLQESEEKLSKLSKQVEELVEENRKLKDGAGVQLGNPTVLRGPDPKTNGVAFVLLESDFVGIPQRVRVILAQRGLTPRQATALHAVRNLERWRIGELMERLQITESHDAKLLIEQLLGLGVIDSVMMGDGRTAYVVSSAGRQALDAVTRRGFAPPPNEAA